jgi:hypothetical protein
MIFELAEDGVKGAQLRAYQGELILMRHIARVVLEHRGVLMLDPVDATRFLMITSLNLPDVTKLKI